MNITAKQTPKRAHLDAVLRLAGQQIAVLEAENYGWQTRMAETRLSAVAAIAKSVFPDASSAVIVVAEDYAGTIAALDESNRTIWRETFDDDASMLFAEQHEPEFGAMSDLLHGLSRNPAITAAARPATRTLSAERLTDLFILGDAAEYWVIQLPRTNPA